jgi:hypothetical protein
MKSFVGIDTLSQQPFVSKDNFELARKKLTEALQDFQPFRLTFKEFCIFKNSKNSTLYLKPEVEVCTFLSFLT